MGGGFQQLLQRKKKIPGVPLTRTTHIRFPATPSAAREIVTDAVHRRQLLWRYPKSRALGRPCTARIQSSLHLQSLWSLSLQTQTGAPRASACRMMEGRMMLNAIECGSAELWGYPPQTMSTLPLTASVDESGVPPDDLWVSPLKERKKSYPKKGKGASSIVNNKNKNKRKKDSPTRRRSLSERNKRADGDAEPLCDSSRVKFSPSYWLLSLSFLCLCWESRAKTFSFTSQAFLPHLPLMVVTSSKKTLKN